LSGSSGEKGMKASKEGILWNWNPSPSSLLWWFALQKVIVAPSCSLCGTS
jgi:hypothetical protein